MKGSCSHVSIEVWCSAASEWWEDIFSRPVSYDVELEVAMVLEQVWAKVDEFHGSVVGHFSY